MKNKLSVFKAASAVVMLLVVLMLGANTRAQGYPPGGATVLGFIPSSLTNSAATNFTLPVLGSTNVQTAYPIWNSALGLYNARNVAISLSASPTANAAGTVQVAIVRSTDGILWETNTPVCVLTLTNGVATVGTNLDTGAYQFYTALWLTNSYGSAGATNIVMKAAAKPGF